MFRLAPCSAGGVFLVLALLPRAPAQDSPMVPAAPPIEELPQPIPPPPPAPEPVLPDRPTAPVEQPPVPAKSLDGFNEFDANGPMGRFGAVGPMGPAVLALTDRTAWYPGQRVSGQTSDLGFVRESLGVTVPLYRDALNTVAFTSNVGANIFSTHAVLPDSGHPFPDTIWNIRFGVNYSHVFANDWMGSLGVNVGSSSDQPFESWRDVTAGINAMLRIPQGERNAWLLSLAYAPLGQISFPVPGVAFQWQPNDWLRMNIGVPFQLTLRPATDWTFTMSYMLLTTIHTQLTYRIRPRLRLYTGFDWNNEGFQLADRVNTRDRFFYYEKRLNVGAKANWRQFQFDVSGGYAFDRYYAEGSGAFGGHNHLDIGNGPYLTLNGSYRW